MVYPALNTLGVISVYASQNIEILLGHLIFHVVKIAHVLFSFNVVIKPEGYNGAAQSFPKLLNPHPKCGR
jgi:hypothetical protein